MAALLVLRAHLTTPSQWEIPGPSTHQALYTSKEQRISLAVTSLLMRASSPLQYFWSGAHCLCAAELHSQVSHSQPGVHL